MASETELYAIDASSIISIEDVFDAAQRKEAWRIVKTLAEAGRLKTAEIVMKEVKRNSVKAFNQINPLRAAMVVGVTNDLLLAAGRFAHKYPVMGHIEREDDSGDPWILAIATVHDCKVICEESRVKEQRMAWACTREGIPCGNIHEMLRANGMARRT